MVGVNALLKHTELVKRGVTIGEASLRGDPGGGRQHERRHSRYVTLVGVYTLPEHKTQHISGLMRHPGW